MGKWVLITGGAGFIGSHLADELLAHDYQVRVLDVLSLQVHGRRSPIRILVSWRFLPPAVSMTSPRSFLEDGLQQQDFVSVHDADITRAQAVLGCTPRVTLAHWHREDGGLAGRTERYGQ